MQSKSAKFGLGEIVKHRIYDFQGVIYDVDPVFANTDEWLASIPEDVRPDKNQPFYHLLAENSEIEYVAYVSEQNLLRVEDAKPLRHPQINDHFVGFHDGVYLPYVTVSH